MKLDYLAAGSADCPLLRLYDFTPAEARELHTACGKLASGEAERIAMHELAFIEAIGGCRLTLVVRTWDQAVVRVGTVEFECGMTAGSWDNIAGLVEPFIRELSGKTAFQWLTRCPGEASLLLSTNGKW